MSFNQIYLFQFFDRVIFYYFLGMELNRCISCFNDYSPKPIPLVDVEYLFDVSENSFNPPPKVKSGVIRLLPRREKLEIKGRSAFFHLVKTAFNQRRKTLRNACRGLFDADVLQEEIFNKRAEQLSIDDFALLSFRMRHS